MMYNDVNKLERLIAVAKMYYQDDMKQADIAKILNVSRPMVSKLLAEAKEQKIVTVKINEINDIAKALKTKIEECLNIQAVVIDARVGGKSAVTDKIATEGYEVFAKVSDRKIKLGLGIGSMVGRMVGQVEAGGELDAKISGEVFPLIGGFGASFKSYHSDELVRIMERNVGLKASYLYLPCLVESEEEKAIYKKTELYRAIERCWARMDMAILNISNLYTTPDLATLIRFGDRLKTQDAVGRFLAYYYDINGDFIEPEKDNVMQIDLNFLKKSKSVVAMCSEELNIKSILGALRTGIFSHCVLSTNQAQKLVNLLEE